MRDVLTEAGESRRASPRKRTKQRSREHLRLPRARGDEGGALMEFALVLPFLALMVFGTIDLGRAFALKNRLTNMAREGAYYGKGHPSAVDSCPQTGADMAQRAIAEDPPLVTDLSQIYVEWRLADGVTWEASPTGCGTDPGTSGHWVRMEIRKDMTLMTPIVSKITGNPVSILGYEQMVIL